MTNLEPGTVLDGKYRIERILGQGGMGKVVAARHVQLDDLVAIKILLPEVLAHPEWVGRFLAEAKAARRLKSEYAAKVIDIGTADDVPYMVMEFLQGEDMAGLLERQGPLATTFAVDCILQACVALAEAHALGIVHRDVKPANLFVTREFDGAPQVKVLDFGIAKISRTTTSDPSLTETHGMMGTVLYSSPEQLASARHVDARTDVWSLGVTLFEMVSGRVPFSAEDIGGFVAQILAIPHLPLRAVLPSAPPLLESILDDCLQKDRDRRIRSVAELAARLVPLGGADAARLAHRAAAMLAAGTPTTSSSSPSLPPFSPPPLPSLQPHALSPVSVTTPSAGHTPSRPSTPRVDEPSLVRITTEGWRASTLPTTSSLQQNAASPSPSTHPVPRPASRLRLALTSVAVAAVATVLVLVQRKTPDPKLTVAATHDQGSSQMVAGSSNGSPVASVLVAPASTGSAVEGGSNGSDSGSDPHGAEAPSAEPPSPRDGELSISTAPSSVCLIDGVPKGATPLRLALPAGRHVVTCAARLDGQLVSKTVDAVVEAGAKLPLTIQLRDVAPRPSASTRRRTPAAASTNVDPFATARRTMGE